VGPVRDRALAVIVGPTASGKSDLALAVAKQVSVEIVVADSRQVYRGMDVGTAKPDASARREVSHHLLDLVAPDERFSVADWVAAAHAAIAEIDARGRLPLLVGGAGLYVSALLDGYDLAASPPSPVVRSELERTLMDGGVEVLAAQLAVRDPEAAARIDLRNPRRVVRALERAGQPAPRNRPWEGRTVIIGLARPLDVLDRRIDERAAALFAQGLLEEVATLLGAGYRATLPPLSGHGYQEAAAFLAGELTLADAIASTARRTRQYARRQRAWFRRLQGVRWLDAADLPGDHPALVSGALEAISEAWRPAY